MRSTDSVGSPARARGSILVALVLGVIASACSVQGSPSPEATTNASTLEPSASGVASATAPSSPAGSPVLGPCEPASLTVRITRWTGAAGHRIADVELQNAGADPCAMFALARPQLVDGRGAILIDGEPSGASEVLEIASGGRLSTEVQDSNYCGSEPVAPVTVAFVFPEGLGRVVAEPDSPASLDGVPPCNGPAVPGTVEMQPWQP